jgi:uncharacterized membrane-anchored protein YitT (DUF2179 family)
VALIYNIFVLPNSVVYGGLGGVAIIVNHFTGINTIIFIDVVTVLLCILSIGIIGIKKTSYTLIGYGAYALMVSLTSPISKYLSISFDSFLLSILICAFIDGIGFGLIYKCGFNTGGADSVIAIIQHYIKIPTGKISSIVNGIIVILGACVFGITKTFYAIIFLRILNIVSDRVILGTSSSKILFIKTKRILEIERFLTNELNISFTLLDSSNGIGLLKNKVIMCVIPSDIFYNLKRELIKIDNNIEIISNDCYTVEGGTLDNLIKV